MLCLVLVRSRFHLHCSNQLVGFLLRFLVLFGLSFSLCPLRREVLLSLPVFSLHLFTYLLVSAVVCNYESNLMLDKFVDAEWKITRRNKGAEKLPVILPDHSIHYSQTNLFWPLLSIWKTLCPKAAEEAQRSFD